MTLDSACEQHTSTFPGAGLSSGSGRYIIDPLIKPVMQVWQTPVLQDHLTGTSHASASSSKLRNWTSQRTLSPLRAKDTRGPVPFRLSGGCGEGRLASTTPDLLASTEPKISVWIDPGAAPQVRRPAVKSRMKRGGPQR